MLVIAGQKARHQYRYLRGFSAIEILIIIAILGLLAAIAVPAYESYVDKTNIALAKSDIVEIQSSIDRYYVANNSFPETLADIGQNNLMDPWGNPYFYTNIVTASNNGSLRKDKNLTPVNSDYDLYSAGKDGKTRIPFTALVSKDDIVRCNNGDFIGLAEDY